MKTRTRLHRLLILALVMVVAALARTPAEIIEADTPTFTDETVSSGLDYEDETWGWAWGDYNDDEYLDLFRANHPIMTDPYQPMRDAALMMNNQDGTFDNNIVGSGISMQEDRHDQAWIDYDDDGDLDLWMSVGGRGGEGEGPNQLFENDGTNHFTNVAEAAGVDYPDGRGRGTAWLDYDLDGDLDLYFTGAESDIAPNALFRNNGDGTFTDVTDLLFVDSFAGAQSQVTVADYDNDGDPDLFLTGNPTRLFRNDGSQFIQVEETANIRIGAAQSAVWGDYNNDGYLDVYVARGALRSFDYQDVSGSELRFAADASAGDEDGIDFGVTGGGDVSFHVQGQRGGGGFVLRNADIVYLGPDGAHPDDNPFTLTGSDVSDPPPYTPGEDDGIYVWQNPAGSWHIRWTAADTYRFSGIIEASTSFDGVTEVGFDEEAPEPFDLPNALFRNNGDGTFSNVAAAAGVDYAYGCRGADWGDYDNDGDLDLFVAVAGEMDHNDPDLLYQNNGNNTFTEVAADAGVQGTDEGYGWGGGWGDYDNDGFLDLHTHNESWTWPLSKGGYQLFHNGGNDNHWIKLDLRGTESNSRGYGAKVRITTGTTTQYRTVDDGSHYFYHYSGPLHVGLGAEETVDEIRIEWPSGLTQVLEDVAADQMLQVTEPTETTGPNADLEVSKSDDTDPVPQGEDIVYTVTIMNTGPDESEDVVIADILPLETEYVSATPDQGTCSETYGVVTCELGDIAFDASVDVEIVVTAAEYGTMSNTARIWTTGTYDPDKSDNLIIEETTVEQPEADLSVTKSDDVDPVTQGDEVTYTVTVANAGPDVANDVLLTDTLPSELSYVSVTPESGTCGEAGGVITCTLGTLDVESVEISVVVSTEASGTFENRAVVSTDSADPDAENNEVTEETTVEGLKADLSVTKSDAADPVTQGDDVTYTVTVTNGGPETAENVVLTDDLPDGVNYVSATPDQGTCSQSGGVVTCELGEIADGTSVDVTIVVETVAYGTLTNVASVSADTDDPNATDNEVTEETTVEYLEADLSVTKSDVTDPISQGDDITYTLTVTNTGPEAATGVVLTDDLPDGVNYVSATPDQGTCSQSGGVVTCELGEIADGTSVDVTIVVETVAHGTLTNAASVSADTYDPNAANDNDSEETTVIPGSCDLGVSKRAAPGPVTVGDLVRYTIDVDNDGPGTAAGVVLTDDLPSGLAYISATAEQGSCSESSGVVTCDLGNIDNGDSVRVRIVVEAVSRGMIVNLVEVTSSTSESDVTNNTASEPVTIDSIEVYLPLVLTAD